MFVCMSRHCVCLHKGHSHVHKTPGLLQHVVPAALEKPRSSVGLVASCLEGEQGR